MSGHKLGQKMVRLVTGYDMYFQRIVHWPFCDAIKFTLFVHFVAFDDQQFWAYKNMMPIANMQYLDTIELVR